MRIEGKKFTNEKINLDNDEFYGCTFDRCVMVYRGDSEIITMNGCTLIGCSWRFEGIAGRTIAFLREVYTNAGEMGADIVSSALWTILGTQVRLPPKSALNPVVQVPTVTCPTCKGSGKSNGSERCKTCGGRGQVPPEIAAETSA